MFLFASFSIESRARMTFARTEKKVYKSAGVISRWNESSVEGPRGSQRREKALWYHSQSLLRCEERRKEGICQTSDERFERDRDREAEEDDEYLERLR